MEATELVEQFEMHPTGCDLYRFATSNKVQNIYRRLDSSGQNLVAAAYRERMSEIAQFYKVNDLDKVPLTVTSVLTETNEDGSLYLKLHATRKDTGEEIQSRTRSTSIIRYLKDRPLPVDVFFVRMQPLATDAAQRVPGFWMVIPITALVDKNPFNGSNHG